jgi:hypothetical protein
MADLGAVVTKDVTKNSQGYQLGRIVPTIKASGSYKPNFADGLPTDAIYARHRKAC